MEESLADRGDGEELIDTKDEGVLSMDIQVQPSQLCLYCMVREIACWLCGKFLNDGGIDAHSLNKV